MDWRLKCLAFHTVAKIPFAYHLAQRHLTQRHFLAVTEPVFKALGYHVANFTGGVALEFGAGSNLLCPLLLSHAGATEVLAVDIARLASVEKINHVVRQLARRLSGEWPELTTLKDLARYRIRYLAPLDMRCTGLPAGSIDFICSTSTFEHIPEDQIPPILTEIKRITSASAVLSFRIDYHDHYSTADRSISTFNFYRYSDAVWPFLNPTMQFQNRLRHSDYQRLFRGFATVEDFTIQSASDLPKLHRHFQRYGESELLALGGCFKLKSPDRIP